MSRRLRQPLAPISLEHAANTSHAHNGTEAAAPRPSASASSSGVSDSVQRTLSPPRSPSKRPAASPLLLSATHRRTREQRSARLETHPASSSSPRSENAAYSPHRLHIDTAAACLQPGASSQRQSSSSPSGHRSGPDGLLGSGGARRQDDGSLSRTARRAQSSPSLASLPRKAQRVATWETRARETSPSPQRPTREKALKLAASEAKVQQPRHSHPDVDWEVRPDTEEDIAAAAALPAPLTPDDTTGEEDLGDENVDPWRSSAACEAAGKTAGRKGTGGRLSLVLAAGADARPSSSPSP